MRFLVSLLLLTLLLAGCPQASDAPRTADDIPADPTDAQLEAALDQAINDVYLHRHLNTDEHAAWQILHGALAYGREFKVRIGRDGPYASAVDYVLAGGKLNGWTLRPGDVVDPETGGRGVRAILEPGTKTGQGHADQWLAILAQCNLPSDTPLMLGEQRHTLGDFIKQVMLDLPFDHYDEYSWSIIGLVLYLGTVDDQGRDVQWTAGDGETWGIRRIVRFELDQEVESSACGGTHRLIGLAMALNLHRKSGGVEDALWQEVDRKLRRHILTAQEYQNMDGSFSSEYFAGPGRRSDLAKQLETTGHTLEFLSTAATDEQLREPWVRRGAMRLCRTLETTRELPLECGALYHAVHGLVQYRERLFGAKPLPPWPEPVKEFASLKPETN